MTPAARIDHTDAGGSRFAVAAPATLVAHGADEVRPVVEAVEQAARAGWWAVGYLAYEAGAAFDPALATGAVGDGDGPPLAWFAVGARVPVADPTGGGFRCGPWRPTRDRAWWPAAVAAVRRQLADGNTYEVNLTTTLHAPFTGSALGLYAHLLGGQGVALGAWCDTGRHVVACASPELFFALDGERIRCRPMKGTARRHPDPGVDREVARRLRTGAKERCENVIVVDLVRNDVGRVAVPGTVQVPALVELERYPTVWQLTSTVEATLRSSATLADVVGALHPSGSITGAPKPSTMGIIAALERRARGPYCGAVGWVGPPAGPGRGPRARFAVGIRTAVVDREAHTASYGVGCGIVWDSLAEAEWDELLAKAAILPGRVEASDG